MTTSRVDPRRQVIRLTARVRSWAQVRRLRAAVVAGRVLLVSLSVLGTYAAERDIGAHDVAVIAVLTTTWLLALRAGAIVSPTPLGPTAATGVGAAVGFTLSSAAAAWLPAAELSVGRLLAMTAAVVVFAGVWESIVRRTAAARRRVLVVGTTMAASAVVQQAERASMPVDLVGLVRSDGEWAGAPDLPVVSGLDGLAEVIGTLEPDLVVLGDDAQTPAVDRLLDAPTRSFRVVGLASFCEHALGRVPVSEIDVGWFVSLLHLRQRGHTRWSKRAFDLVTAGVVLLLALPVIAAVALVLLPSGPVLYRQTRLGERGRRFQILKFRTMVGGAEAPGEAVWASADDPRVTRIGRFLRHTHLDELPQLVNVLRGEMSLVGPRPERPEFVDLLEREVPFWHRRLLVKPGVTGWAQLRSGYAADAAATAEKLSYDLWYLRNSSVLVDLAICVATAVAVLSAFVPRRLRSVAARPAARGELG